MFFEGAADWGCVSFELPSEEQGGEGRWGERKAGVGLDGEKEESSRDPLRGPRFPSPRGRPNFLCVGAGCVWMSPVTALSTPTWLELV